MLLKKNFVVVGITTFNTDMLKISVSAAAKIKSKFILIIHNDNPDTTVTLRDIRAMGYRGRAHIINATKNIGLRAARLRILDVAGVVARGAEWIIYADDDDILISADVPGVSADNFAVIQNSLVIQRRVSDLIAAANRPETVVADGENIIIRRPNIGMRGTAVRMDIMRGMATILHAVGARLDEIEASMSWRPPVDAMMWSALCAYAGRINPNAAPIYMDSVNYIENRIDDTATKYGRPAMPARGHNSQIARAKARFDAVIAAAMAEC